MSELAEIDGFESRLAVQAKLVESARRLAEGANAERTRVVRDQEERAWLAWCDRNGFVAVPPDPMAVCLWFTELFEAGRAVSTINRRSSMLNMLSRRHGGEPPSKHPAVAAVLAGIRRHDPVEHGRPVPASKKAIYLEDLRHMVSCCDLGSTAGIRDRALLLVGWVSSRRRSELAALDVSDGEVTREGLVLTVRRSKTDQEGRGHRIGIPYGSRLESCPVRAWQAWTALLDGGPLWRPVDRNGVVLGRRLTDHAIGRLVQRYVAAIGLPPALYGAHSLRAGSLTEMARAGVEERHLMAWSGHRSVRVLRGYIREGQLFDAVSNPVVRLGL